MSKDDSRRLKFDSAKIKPPKTEYFVKIKKNPFSNKLFTPLKSFTVSKKQARLFFFTLGILAVLVILILFAISHNIAQNPSQDSSPPENISAGQIYEKATTTAKSSSPTAFFEAIAIFDEAIADKNNGSIKNEIAFLKANFYVDHKYYDEAIALLLETEQQKDISGHLHASVLLKLSYIYYAVNDTDNSELWATKYNDLYPGGN